MPRYAAIDIGSNSVRMMAAEVEANGPAGQPPRVLVEDRQVTRLGASVFQGGSISKEALDFLCATLERQVALFRPLDVLALRAVATAAVRDASNREEFLERTARVIGQPVEIISGQEEARLIHLGVESRWPHPKDRIMIADIGGGSAEIIEAEDGVQVAAFSRPLGAVRLQAVFLKHDPPDRTELRRLDEFVAEKLAVVFRKIERGGFARFIGTSATAAAVVSAANRIPRARREAADRQRASIGQIRKLERNLVGMTLEERRAVPGLGPRRAEIIVPGVIVLRHVLEWYDAPFLSYSTAGVRDGIIRDLADRGVGRERARMDAEQRAQVEQFARRFAVDLKHARKVAEHSRQLFHALEPWHKLKPEEGRLLEAAAYLRDVGHMISDTSHHKHSHYIVANSDLAGFTDAEKSKLALLCRYHRKSMPSARHEEFVRLGEDDQRTVLLLAPLLRIADAIDRSRDQRVESIRCELRAGGALLTLEALDDASLEVWAAERCSEDFRNVYQKGLAVAAVRL
jgi:exopolyphosphatase/guanosine-5'-triphosphate,3'-diphosphate pyrophosphatase